MYTIESYKNPFWAENSGFMTGRDPLGIQNSSITVYSRLLPGMTNLTLRLRYYGLYLWLLNEYSLQVKNIENDNLKGHFNFIRRAELIIAFIMRIIHPNEQSIIGSDYTTKRELDIKLNGYYNIHLGADKISDNEKEDVYWDFPSGALGQYYAGSLIALKLIKIKNKFFVPEPEGLRLASVFASAIPESQRTKFIKVIKEGRLSIDDIEKLNGFLINNIKVNSDEWNYYKVMLLSADDQDIFNKDGSSSFMRKQTIGLYLNYISNEISQPGNDNFIISQFRSNPSFEVDEASFGWSYYYINEAIHFALETIFWGMLLHLDGREEEVELFIKEMSDTIILHTPNNLTNSPEKQVVDLLKIYNQPDLISSLNELESLVKSPANSELAMMKAFLLLLIIHNTTENIKDEIASFEKKYRISTQKGRVSENLDNYITQSIKVTFKAMIKETIKKIMNDHINTAYRKMGNSESNLLKFIIEDGIITHVQTMIPKHTSPRLRTLTNFMKDLSLIDTNNKMTSVGSELLNSFI